eukprot:m51a1_g2975 hypothetical protein (196) ;mRNA; f:709380-710645
METTLVPNNTVPETIMETTLVPNNDLGITGQTSSEFLVDDAGASSVRLQKILLLQLCVEAAALVVGAYAVLTVLALIVAFLFIPAQLKNLLGKKWSTGIYLALLACIAVLVLAVCTVYQAAVTARLLKAGAQGAVLPMHLQAELGEPSVMVQPVPVHTQLAPALLTVPTLGSDTASAVVVRRISVCLDRGVPVAK